MKTYALAHWGGGEVVIATVVTRVSAYTHSDVRDVTLVGLVEVGTVEAIRRALVGELTAPNRARAEKLGLRYSVYPGEDGMPVPRSPTADAVSKVEEEDVTEMVERLKEAARA